MMGMRVAGVVLLLCGLSAAQSLPDALKGQVLVTRITFAEGPAFDAGGSLYFVNYQRTGAIGRIRPGGSPEVWAQLPAGANAFGLKVDAAGNLFAADFNSRKLFRVSAAG